MAATRWPNRLPARHALALESGGLVIGLVLAQLLATDAALTLITVAQLAVLERANSTDLLARQARHDPKTGLLTLPAWREATQARLTR